MSVWAPWHPDGAAKTVYLERGHYRAEMRGPYNMEVSFVLWVRNYRA
jgi:hypothetical protein